MSQTSCWHPVQENTDMTRSWNVLLSYIRHIFERRSYYCLYTNTYHHLYTFISLAQEKEINEFWQTCFELVGFCCRSVTIIVCSRLQDIDNAMNQNKAYFYKFGLVYVWRSVYNLYQKVNPLNINLKTIFQTLQSDNSQAITK